MIMGIIFVASLALLIQIPMMTSVHSAYALTRYYNCVTKVANNHGTLTLSDIENCYDKVFKGAQNSDEFGHSLK